MSRINKILSWTLPDTVFESYGIAGAYCACLEPDEACQVLLRAVAERVDLRPAVLRKVSSDIESGLLPCHIDLIDRLLEMLVTVGANSRQSVGYCLSTLAERVGGASVIRRKIEAAFLESKYISVRRRGYKCIANSSEVSREVVLRAWGRFSDVECAWLITKTFPTAFLAEHRSSLAAAFTEGWQISKLYLRVAEVNPSVVSELRDIDPISYCYVRAKLRSPIGFREARAIVDRVRAHEKFGLLVWSFGRMGLWRALEYVESQLVDIQRERSEAVQARVGRVNNTLHATSLPPRLRRSG